MCDVRRLLKNCLLILCVCILIPAFWSGAAEPELVQISDYTANEFYQGLKIHNAAKETNLPMSEMIDEIQPNKPYDIHAIISGKGDDAVVIGLFTNKSGYVSKITIQGNAYSGIALSTAYKWEYVVLGVLGIDDATDQNFMSFLEGQNPPFQTAIWNEQSNRNILVEHGPSPTTVNLFYIRLTAYDQTFE